MATFDVLLLPGDGIGPEVMSEVERVAGWLASNTSTDFNTETSLVGGCAYDAHGVAVTDETIDKALQADAIMLGAVGGPKWDGVPYDVRPEAGLLRLRKDLDLFANLRPAICFPALADASSLKRELVEGLDILILRELTGGTYFGEPKEMVTLEDGQKRCRRHHRLHDQRDRAYRPRRFRAGPQAQQQGALGRQAQCHEEWRSLERSGHPGAHSRVFRCRARS